MFEYTTTCESRALHNLTTLDTDRVTHSSLSRSTHKKKTNSTSPPTFSRVTKRSKRVFLQRALDEPRTRTPNQSKIPVRFLARVVFASSSSTINRDKHEATRGLQTLALCCGGFCSTLRPCCSNTKAARLPRVRLHATHQLRS